MAVYLMNWMPSRVLSYKAPLEVLSSDSPLFPSPTKIFGYICYVHIPKLERFKLDPNALKYIFLDYGIDKKGYKCYHPSQVCVT